MRSSTNRILKPMVWLALFLPVWARAELERHPLSFGTSLDFGQIVKGKFYEQPGKDSIADGQPLTRTGVFFTEGATYNKRLDIKFTLGGLFWSVLPEAPGGQAQGSFEKRLTYFGAGIGQAQAIYTFGDVETSNKKIQVGLFPIKYNPDAKNLGEYLYRSGTYPGVLYSGGWSYLNSAAYLSQGLRFTWTMLGGSLTHEFTLSQERDFEPIHDISPSYLVTWKPTSFLEVASGIVWAHGIPLKDDSLLTPKIPTNAYVEATGKPLNYRDTTGELSKPHHSSTDPRVRPDGDPAVGTAIVGGPYAGQIIIDSTANGTPREQLGFYTFRGFKTMARFSLNVNALLGMSSTDPFKLYGEWALLGLKDYPFFYSDKSERMPMMMGIDIPTHHILDMFCMEVEYHKSRFPNSLQSVFYYLRPNPVAAEAGDFSVYDIDGSRYTNPADPLYRAGERDSLVKEFKKDDWKWSVFARKELRKGITVYAQAASDHLRHILTEGGGKFRPNWVSSTREPGQWYYVVRLELAI